MPEVPWYFSTWYNDFYILSHSRTAGMNSYNPIDIPSIIQYAQAVGVKGYELPGFIRIMQYLDSIFLVHHAKKASKSAPRSDVRKRGK